MTIGFLRLLCLVLSCEVVLSCSKLGSVVCTRTLVPSRTTARTRAGGPLLTRVYRSDYGTVYSTRAGEAYTSYSIQASTKLEEQKRTKYKINGTATTAIEKSNPNLPAYEEHLPGMVRVRYSYQGSPLPLVLTRVRYRT